ncbi:MAG TPA: FAD-binding oxidoreductase [Steroidobacteraceae bacterium]|nr:FAD-binding oxidoreductase [Steroidobacteraceae bacterium]
MPSLSDHIHSYYSATAHAVPDHPPLRGAIDCDVCVVGAGIAGCSSALHLAQRGFRVVLLEEKRVGWGASGRSGAQALPGFSCGQDKLIALVGPDAARALWSISVEGLSLMRSLIAEHRIDCDWVDGQLQAAIKPRHRAELLAQQAQLEADYGYRSLRWCERDELASLLESDRYIGGLYDRNSGHLHPLNYTLGLAAAAERLGIRVFEGTRALRYESGTGVRVHTPEGEVRCRQLVLCGNTSLNGTAPALARKIIGVSTYIVATEPLGAERAQRLITNNMSVSDMNWVLDYFRRSSDHRLLFGGRVSYSGFDPANTANATRARMLRVFPQLTDARIDYTWGGQVDITLNRAPHFGRLAPEVYFLQGFSGHGIALTGIAGKLIAEAVAGTAERFDVFARIPHRDFPGGPALRRPALILAMLFYRLRDVL